MVAGMVWLRDMRPKDVAEVLGITEAAVSQHLSHARAVVGEYPRERGIDVPVKGPSKVHQGKKP